MDLRRFANSLITRLIAFGVLLTLSGVALRYQMLTNFLREDLAEVVAAQQVALAEYVAKDIDYKLIERRRLLERLAVAMPRDLLRRPEALRHWLGERHDLLPLFSLGLAVADMHGVVIADYPPLAGRVGASILEVPGFREVLAGDSGVGTPMLGPVSRQPILPMGASLKDADGKPQAVLVGITELAAPGFLDSLLQGRIGKSGGYLLISPRDRLFVAASDPAMVLKPTPPPGVNRLHDRAMAGYRGSGVTVNAKGVEEISAMVSVPSTGWFVVARLPTAEAFSTVARVQAYVVRYGLGAAAMVLLVAGALVFWLLRPLRQSAATAGRMTRGEIPLAPLPVVRQDEVGYLTTAFNGLIAKVTASQSELLRMAHHDLLTGLPNRALLADRMEQALARARRGGTDSRVAVLFLDLDGFKPINDTLGHEVGDAALRETARRLAAVVRETDTLARVGGDEFVLLATDLDDSAAERARLLADKCIEAVAPPMELGGGVCRVGVSVGVALCGGGCSGGALLVAADKAMYQAKQNGRGRAEFAPRCACEGG